MNPEAPRIIGINTAPDKGLPMVRRQEVAVERGLGIEGDRYALGRGAWSKVREGTVRDISLIAAEGINTANNNFGTTFTFDDTRRNLLTSGADLTQLQEGQVIFLGEVITQVGEACTPCERPAKLTKKSNFEEAFTNRGGLRVAALNNATLRRGDPMYLPQASDQWMLKAFLAELDQSEIPDGIIEEQYHNFYRDVNPQLLNCLMKILDARRPHLATKVKTRINNSNY